MAHLKINKLKPATSNETLRKPILVIFLFVLACAHLQARAAIWQPSPGHIQVLIWPGAVPDAMPNPKPEAVGPPEGREWWPRANDVSRPTMAVYAAKGRDTGVAVVVFPGGGYQFLAMNLEGTEICDWLTSRGITCVLLKYRVPDSGPTMKDGGAYYSKVQTALQDAQRTLGLVRQHAAEWHVDPHKVGVIGFSAGGKVGGVSARTRMSRRRFRSVPGVHRWPAYRTIVKSGRQLSSSAASTGGYVRCAKCVSEEDFSRLENPAFH
jgi:acetyl esterase/lipase